MKYTFYFGTEKDAFNFIGNAQEIAKAYGTVSLSDLSDLFLPYSCLLIISLMFFSACLLGVMI